MAGGARGATLYLRGLREEVVRESKARAARRGITLTAYVTELLEREVSDQPAEDRVSAGVTSDLAWYRENRERLSGRHADQYVAVVDHQVVDHDREFAALAHRVFERLGDRTVVIPNCILAERLVSLPSPRVTDR